MDVAITGCPYSHVPISTHAQKLILRKGRESTFFRVEHMDCEEALTGVFISLKLGDLESKSEDKAALSAVASNTIARLSNILPTGSIVHFLMDRLEKVRAR